MEGASPNPHEPAQQGGASRLGSTNERSPLLVERDLVAAAENAETQGNDGFADPDKGEDGECKSGPVDESVVGLVNEHGPEVPGDGNAGREVTLRGGERIGGRSRFEEEERKEDENLGPDAGVVVVHVDTERSERGEHDKDGSPAMVEGEGQVDEELVRDIRGLVILLNNVVDVCHSG